MRILMLLIVLCLTACQTKQQALQTPTKAKKAKLGHLASYPQGRAGSNQDGAPDGPLPTKFKLVKPANEPISRYGNPAAYRVNGKTYEVMTTSSGYKARGLASWYGTKFHKKRTSSGENYNLYELTAAHKTLPIPTYVRVKNLNNGRVATVKVNDRGPFHEGRIIDLSYGAAVKLGLLPKGTAPVEIEALSTHNAKGKPAHYYLQVGAFSTESLARNLKSNIAKLSSTPVFVERYQKLYIVKAGPFANKQMTDSLRAKLQKNGVHNAITMLQ